MWSGGRIFLNAEATNGWVAARLVDDSGRPEPGTRTARLQKTTGARLALDFGPRARGSAPKAREIRRRGNPVSPERTPRASGPGPLLELLELDAE